MLRLNKMRLLLSLGMLLTIVMTACQPAATPEPTEAPAEATEAPEAPTEVPEEDAEPIVFGMVAPMTGDLADYGTQVERGIRMAMDEINAEGGINGRPLDIKVCDDKCDPTEAAACAQRFANDPEIFAVLGHICSSCTLAGAPIYDQAGVTMMTVNSTNPTITEQGWEHVFRSTPHDGQQGPYMAEFAIEELGAKNIAIIYGSSDYGRGLMEATKPEVPGMGGEVVAVETYAPGEDKDFSAQLTKIAQAEPDALLVMGQYSEGALIAKQRVAAGLGDIPLVACAANQHSQFIELGGQGAEGAYVVVYFDLTKPDPRTQEIVQKTVDKYGEEPAEQVPWGYDGVYIFAEAIKQGATKETMPEYLHQVEYDGVTGQVKFNEKGQVVGLGQDVIVVENGEFVSYVPGETEAPAAPTGEPIVFGMVAPMTGDLADYGTQVERGIRMAIDEINAEGGINGRPLDIKVCDDKCDPTEAAACAQRLANDPEIFAVLGHICSSCTLAGAPIYDQAGVTMMTVNSTNPTITEQGWEHVFRSTPHDGQQGPYMAKFAIEELGAKNIAIIYGSSDYGRGLMEATRPEVPDMGGEVVAVETYAPGEDKDFSAQLTKIAQAEPDALLVMGQYADGALIAKQRVAAGLGDIPLVACAANQHSQFIELGGQGAEGAYVVVYFDLTKPDPRTQEIVQKTLDKYGEEPAEQVPWGYDGAYVFAQAIEQGATKETMPEYLHQVEYDGVTGQVKFDEKGQVVGLGQDVIVVENGEFVSYTP